MTIHIAVDRQKIETFARKWEVVELSLFGSVLTEDFNDQSDVDVLVRFASHSTWSLFDLVTMQDELVDILGREIDLVEDGTIRNPFRFRHIMTHREVLYAA